MPRGSFFYGPGFWKGGPGPARGAGFRGNPHPFCRAFPWLPRRWWAEPSFNWPASTPGYESEAAFLRAQAEALRGQLEAIEKRLEELEKDSD